jgi:hypothetical protein
MSEEVKKERKTRTKLRPLNETPRPREVLVSGETSEIVCKVCGQNKTRILVGRYKKDKKWVSPDGGQFNGKVCDKCHSKAVYKSRLIKKEAAKL